MTKAEIVSEISDRTRLEKGAVSACVESFMDVVKDSMAKGDNIYLRGFGSFLIKHKAAKTARNIWQGTTIQLEAHNVPAFKPCSEFKNMVR
ncbi:MAG: integration host factor subunit beta [Muribaculaceae bacterium]|nr:integration host factor subunit beta [Muribaculaceae bacterium]MDE7465546.1 integration host factor subunit beta [Muribaculaceae bacterium]